MDKAFITDLTDGMTTASFFLAKNIQTASRKNGEPYLKLILADRSGQAQAVYWEPLTDETRGIKDGDIVKVQVQVGTYQGARQLTIQRLRKATPEEVALEDFLPRSAQDPQALLGKLDALVAGFTNPHLRGLLAGVFTHPPTRAAFAAAPGGVQNHHAALGGLLEHSMSTATICDFLATHYPTVDRELLIAAAILHDLGKTREMAWERVFTYTDSGRLIGHITLGASMVGDLIREMADFPEVLATHLLHCILSHHGSKEWGSPIEPMTLEAIILHDAENLDSKVATVLAHAEASPDPQHEGWTTWSKPLSRYLRLPSAETP